MSLKKTPVVVKEKGKSKKNKLDGNLKNDRNKEDDMWVVFCDFHEITHTVTKEATVTIYKQDNKRMVRQNPTCTAFLVMSTSDCHF